jgi:alkylation response protein AidB-like acyl-CoA dehydrogenase
MDMLFTRDQEDMVTSLSRYFDSTLPRETLHTADRPGQQIEPLVTEEYWSGLAEMGLFALGVSEDDGGAGLGAADQVAAFREVGRHLGVGPLIGTVLAAQAAAGASEGGTCEAFVSGRARAAVAFPQPGTDPEVGSRVTGTFRIYEAETAGHVLVLAEGTAALVPVDGIKVVAVNAIDPTAPVAIADIDATATLIVDGRKLSRLGTLLQAAVFCGMAEASLAESVDFAKVREQFGRPIGAFQAVKHRCAEMAVRAEVAFFQTVYAALVEDEAGAGPEFHAASALVVARDAARLNAADDIQNHGGMGFTAEATPHLYARRQISSADAFGARRANLEVVAEAANPV